MDTTSADDDDEGVEDAGVKFFLSSLLRGVNGGNNPTRSSTSDGVSEFTNRLITEDIVEDGKVSFAVTMSNVRPPANTGEMVPPWPDIGRSMDSLRPPPGQIV